MTTPVEDAWGRIDAAGTVYVRGPDGERVIGSWQAGTADEGLAFYRRRYDDLAAEVAVLEGRATLRTADPKAIAAAARRLRESLPAAAAIGDLAALDERLAGVLATLDERRAEAGRARQEAAAAAAARKLALVEEAERLAGSTDWKATGDRLRAIVEDWKAVRGVDRKTDGELWQRFAAARRDFDHRRRAHFAQLEQQRTESAAAKERLAAEAEKLAASDDWAATARRFRDLMAQWKAAGRAGRDADDALWERFRAAQDSFFARRSEVFAARDAEQADNVKAKEALLAEAESLDPTADLDGARKRLRMIHDRWEKVGRVPRDQENALERRLAAVEQRVREAGSTSRHVVETESTLVVRLRESVAKLEARLERARAAGDDRLAAETEQALATQREWLAQASPGGGAPA